jgi:NitT/TauT family transport system permease protein
MATEPVVHDMLEEEIHGLDALDALDARIAEARGGSIPSRIWSAVWPKLMALVAVLGVWQLIVWSRWKPPYVISPPKEALSDLWAIAQTARFRHAFVTTMARGFIGFAVAVAIGTALGVVVAQSSIVRRAFGSFLAGLQSMPSIVWFPFAIIVFKLSESAILFVVVLGAAPSIANGLVSGIDQIPPLLVRAGRVMGAKGLGAYRHVVLPAALPTYVAGLKQGWAFAWRSLMAGELIVTIANRTALGAEMHNAQDLSDMRAVIAYMIVVLFIGIAVDGLIFGSIEKRLLRRRGLFQADA